MTKRVYRQLIAVAGMALSLYGCGGGYSNAESSGLSAQASMSVGASPFIAVAELQATDLSQVRTVEFTIDPKPGATAAAVSAQYSSSYLTDKGHLADLRLRVPMHGFYAGRTNTGRVRVVFADGTFRDVPISYEAPPYVDPNHIFDRPSILTAAVAGSGLGFSYFYMKSSFGPVIVDTDGEVRWALSALGAAQSSVFFGNTFIVGAADLTLQRYALDGTVALSPRVGPSDYANFTHNFERGKTGVLVEVDRGVDGKEHIESTLAEVLADGTILKQWDFETIFASYMLSQGDDPSTFVRPGVDWFHMNTAIYDPRDDTLIVSSRENFVVKIDYQTGAIVWVFGDPTRYWFAFPSLRAKALSLTGAALYPSGQHALSITAGGALMLFDNGQPASNPPPGGATGAFRAYSGVAAFQIDAVARTATQLWRFDHDPAIKAPFCSSAYEAADGSVLVSYATVDNFSHARLIGLDSQRQIAFDFQYDTTPCGTSWNAVPVPLERLEYR